jgi:soluble lytic murein transglycosylase-like protein
MSSPIASILITPAEAAALSRSSQVEQLAARAAEGAAPTGEASFATALEAASSAQEAGPEPEAMPNSAPEALPGTEAEPVSEGAAGEASSALAADAIGSASQAGTTGEATAAAASAAPTYASYSGLAPTYGTGSSYPLPASTLAPTSATGASGASSGASAYESLIQQAAERNGVEPALLKGLIEQESGFNPAARSSAGAMGLTQLMPSTAASLGVSEPLNPTQSIEGGAKLLGELLHQFGGNVSYALAAYNAGAGAVHEYGGVPPYPETEAYVAKVLANAQSYR